MKLRNYRSYSGQACLLGGLLTAAFGLGSVPALAQDGIDEIFITGSRIARDPNLAGANPVQSVGAEQIRVSGDFNITDVVNDVPALLNSTTSEAGLDQSGAFNAGANVLSLRGLGSNRTLTLVDGLRHVGGVQGSARVDVGSIPMNLVERVEVLTGGASAVYGADAVTGVVNFIMKDDFEGLQVDMNYGLSGEGDGQQSSITATWGTNFDDDRGNFAVSVDYRSDEGLSFADRDVFVGSGRDWINPFVAFQKGDITATGTPNFSDYYVFSISGGTDYGQRIPDAATFVTDYNAAFPGSPITAGDLTDAELALIDRAAAAPPRLVAPGRTFALTSGYGSVVPGSGYTFSYDAADLTPDLNGNGLGDCAESASGVVATDFALGPLGGCWNIDEDGNLAVFNDGLFIQSGFNTFGFGGDSFNTINQPYGDIVAPEDVININLIGHYDLSDSMRLFGSAKYVEQSIEYVNDPSSYWDLLPGFPDNPFLPAALVPAATTHGNISITVDPIGFRSVADSSRETSRFVIGLEGEFDNGIGYEFALNQGQYQETLEVGGAVIVDRWFAALDAVTDPGTGDPACRISVDPAAPALNTPFDIPTWDPGYYSFDPNDCVPIDIWSGLSGYQDQAARDFVTTTTRDEITIEQTVFSAIFTGQLSNLSWAGGIEYREESSEALFDDFQLGLIPEESAFFAAGTPLISISDNPKLVHQASITVANETGEFDATDIFLEASLPILVGEPFAEELTLEAAVRVSDYSTIGTATTWKVNTIWAPTDELTFRGGVSQAVRAPNVTELFGPTTGTTYRPEDPCDATNISSYMDPALEADIIANCIADFQAIGLAATQYQDVGGNYIFTDPLTAAFPGTEGGNPNLTEETADTYTVGFVWQPAFANGFDLTVDYWDITIEDAIGAVDAQDITDGCYVGPALNNTFCTKFERNNTNGGFIFLESSDVNFSAREAAGVDIAASYGWTAGDSNFDLTFQGTIAEKNTSFTNPVIPDEENPILGEIRNPEYAGNIFLNWNMGDLTLGLQTQYLGEQLLDYVEIETAQARYGEAVFMDEIFIHDINATWMVSDELTLYSGIKNVTDEEPFITNNAYPASARGRFFHVGFSYSL